MKFREKKITATITMITIGSLTIKKKQNPLTIYKSRQDKDKESEEKKERN